MEAVTSATLETFLQHLGERSSCAGALYLLGGSALCLLGNPRTTADVDYTFEVEAGSLEQFQSAVAELAAEMRLDVEAVPMDEFIPLPPQARERRRAVGRYGRLDVYLFDLYSIALSKIARGFEADVEDVMFLLGERLIEFGDSSLSSTPSCPTRPSPTFCPVSFATTSKRSTVGLRGRRDDLPPANRWPHRSPHGAGRGGEPITSGYEPRTCAHDL